MIKILFKISKNIESRYLDSLRDVVDTIKKEAKLEDFEFELTFYEFSKSEKIQITVSRNTFLKSKVSELNDSAFDSIIYVPDSSLNLKGNYLWYSIGHPKNHLMIISSFLFKGLIEGKLDFGFYVFILYSQFLARFTVELEKPHDISKYCLNDHCGEQSELLNVLKNEKDVFCEECLSRIRIENKEYYHISKKIIDILKRDYDYQKKIIKEEKIKLKTKIIGPKESKGKMVPAKGCWYEFEIYMAKKCPNLSKLYNKLNKLLLSSISKIDGYSLYEVSGGWKGEIEGIKKTDWKLLCSLRKDFEKKEALKDVIRPLIETKNKKYAIFDETSVVLRIIVDLQDYEDNIFDESSCPIVGEINEIFEEVIETEQNILFTLKKLHRKGSILIGKK